MKTHRMSLNSPTKIRLKQHQTCDNLPLFLILSSWNQQLQKKEGKPSSSRVQCRVHLPPNSSMTVNDRASLTLMEGNNLDWDRRLELSFGPDCIFQYLKGAYFFLLKVTWQLWGFSKMKGSEGNSKQKNRVIISSLYPFKPIKYWLHMLLRAHNLNIQH